MYCKCGKKAVVRGIYCGSCYVALKEHQRGINRDKEFDLSKNLEVYYFSKQRHEFYRADKVKEFIKRRLEDMDRSLKGLDCREYGYHTIVELRNRMLKDAGERLI